MQLLPWVPVLAVSLLASGGGVAADPAQPKADSYMPPDHRDWLREREESLRSPTGYLALTGLYWLDDGEFTFGSAPDNDLVILNNRGPAHIGRFEVTKEGGVTVLSAPGVQLTRDGQRVDSALMVSDASGQEPTKIKVGELTFWLIERSGGRAIRLSDPQSPFLTRYAGTPRYAYSPAWRLRARFEPPTAETVRVTTVLGTESDLAGAGRLHFTVNGEPHTLYATSRSNGKLFVIFGDETNGKETYGGGRFLEVSVPENGQTTVIDFNRGYNPPCAYSPFTTCPLAPAQNRLPFRIEAGEKRPKKDE